MDFLTALSTTIVFLFASPDIGSNPVPIGTGFLVRYEITKEKYVPFIVTAKHVIGDFKKVFARFNSKEEGKLAIIEYDLEGIKKTGDYFENQDSGVDIAVFRTPHFNVTKYESIPIEMIAKKEDFASEDIKQTDRVIFPGLLINFLGGSKNFPIMRDGSIALIPSEKVPISYIVGSRTINTQQELIFLNSLSFQGLSGSPIFLWPGPRLKNNSFNIGGARYLLLGVMHGFYPAIPREVNKIETTDAKYY
ncbi:MAG: hypothetical protein ABSF48_15140 [Thermodesulfobacteriota bacterium]|jgi:hypothetical protein